MKKSFDTNNDRVYKHLKFKNNNINKIIKYLKKISNKISEKEGTVIPTSIIVWNSFFSDSKTIKD